jgi:hypothetical protein
MNIIEHLLGKLFRSFEPKKAAPNRADLPPAPEETVDEATGLLQKAILTIPAEKWELCTFLSFGNSPWLEVHLEKDSVHALRISPNHVFYGTLVADLTPDLREHYQKILTAYRTRQEKYASEHRKQAIKDLHDAVKRL